MPEAIFDGWATKYDGWFETPVGQLVKQYELKVLLKLLRPGRQENILDAGCGTGIFTEDVLRAGALVTGTDLSLEMLKRAGQRSLGGNFSGLCSDVRDLPFANNCFDKSFSMTAIEFIEEADRAMAELNRVTRPGGVVVVTTLNSLSPWAEKRRRKAQQGHELFQNIIFRSPDDMRRLAPQDCTLITAVHFQKNDPITDIPAIERRAGAVSAETGAFLAVCWQKK